MAVPAAALLMGVAAWRRWRLARGGVAWGCCLCLMMLLDGARAGTSARSHRIALHSS